MNGLRNVRVAGTGMYVPPRVVTNADLEERMDTSDEWIRQRTGIRERRYVDPGTGPVDLAFEASTRAIDAAGIRAQDLDAIVVPTLSSQHDFPGTSAFLQERRLYSDVVRADSCPAISCAVSR